MKLLILAPILLSACTVAPLKEAVEGAVHRRVEARQDHENVQVCTCQTQCAIAEIPNS